MTEPGPFTPPSGALTPRQAAAETPPTASGAVLPPPTGAPIGWAPPAPPPPPRRRRWLIPVIAGGVLAFLALLVGVGVVAAQLAGNLRDTTIAGPFVEDPTVENPVVEQPEDLLDGDPGSPVAAEPLACVDCFRLGDVQNLALPDASYLRVGLALSDDSLYRMSASEEQADQTGWWTDDGGTPDACYFTYPKAPLFFDPGIVDDLPARGDTVLYPAWHTDRDEYYLFTEGIRMFDDTAAATAYLTRLPDAVAGCPDYDLTEVGWTASLSATPAMELPPSVASYGWVETDGYSRYFATDVQRGNLVVRLTLFTDAYGPSEADFRDLVAEYAEVLAALEPAS
jgi:hypothetical protein